MSGLCLIGMMAVTLAGGQPPASPDPVSPAAQPSTGDRLEARLAGVGEKLTKVTDLRADFVQRKKTALLKTPIESKGTIVSRGPAVLWRTREPRSFTMLVNDAEVSIYYPDDKLAEIYPMGAGFRDAAGGPLPRLEQLRERFEIAELDASALADAPGRDRLLGIRLTPKSDEVRKHVQVVRVLIDESVPCANRVVVVDPEGEETDLRFLNVRINTGLTEAEVGLDLPKDVRISRPVPKAPPAESQPPTPGR